MFITLRVVPDFRLDRATQPALSLTRFAEMMMREQTGRTTLPRQEVDVHELSRSRFFAVLAVGLLFIWAITDTRGWIGFALLIVGLIVLDMAAIRWGADSRDGRNWTNGRGLTQGADRAIDQKFVEAEIARIEHQFRPKG